MSKLRMINLTAGLITAGLLASAWLSPAALAAWGLLSTKHNLSVSGPGEIKATQEERVCIFCHTPHHASSVTPLWSRPESSVVYDLYQSSTLTAKPGQPSGASRLCLSCHDGTIALGALYGTDPNSNTIQMAGGITKLPSTRNTNLTGSSQKDLTNDHPISFAYDNDLAQTNGQLKTPAEVLPPIRLQQGMLQCNSCHNPHRDPYGKFLVVDNKGSALCVSCHKLKGWSESGHQTNASIAPGGCGNCHVSHNAQRAQRLLKFNAEEQNCLPCHNLGTITNDIQSQLAKPYTHPVAQYTGIHDESENPLTAQKHVECDDCHNSHYTKAASALAPAVSGPLLGVRGVTSNRTQVSPANYEYEICYRCHADNSFSSSQAIVRVIQESNMRLNFFNTNPSYHPVAAQGKGNNVPSLRTGYSTASQIYCCDCHGSDDSVKAGGTGPNGPHGSQYQYILLARYETSSNSLSYDDKYYQLCYRCHDQLVLLDATKSAFPPHNLHVVQKSIPCFVCHDPHGVSGGTVTANAHLINFETHVVTSGSYDSTARTCNVSCHSTIHAAY